MSRERPVAEVGPLALFKNRLLTLVLSQVEAALETLEAGEVDRACRMLQQVCRPWRPTKEELHEAIPGKGYTSDDFRIAALLKKVARAYPGAIDLPWSVLKFDRLARQLVYAEQDPSRLKDPDTLSFLISCATECGLEHEFDIDDEDGGQ